MILQGILSLLRASLFTAPIIMILLLLAKFSYKKYSANMRLGIWIMIGFFLLFPVGIENLFHWISNILFGQTLFETDYSMVARAFAEIEQTAITGAVLLTEPTTRISVNPYQIGAMIYFIIAFLVLAYFVTQHLFYGRKMFRWGSKITDEKILDTLDKCKGKLGIKSEIPIIYSEGVSSPLLMGFFKPIIVLPKRESSQSGLSAILQHELTHYKRKDLWVQLLFLMVQSLYWANPLVYFMRKQVVEDIELACDTQVIKMFTHKEKKDYCYTILSFASTKNYSLTTNFRSKNGTKKRMESILNNKKQKGILFVILVLLLTIVLGACMYGKETTEVSPVEVAPTVEIIEVLPEEETAESWIDPMEDLAGFQRIQKEREQEIDEVYADLGIDETYTPEIPDITLGWPVQGYYNIEVAYGWRFGGTDFHTGIDINGEDIMGVSVVSVADGKVLAVNRNYTPGVGYGMYIILEHEEGFTTLYGQLNNIYVKVGQEVKTGETIGAVGNTGFSAEPHLHFETRVNRAHVDPYEFYKEELEEN